MGNHGDAGTTEAGGEFPFRPGDQAGGVGRSAVAGATPRRLPPRRRKAVGGGNSALEPGRLPRPRVAGASTAWEAGNEQLPAPRTPPGGAVAHAALSLAGRVAEAAADAKYRSDLLRDLLTGAGTDL